MHDVLTSMSWFVLFYEVLLFQVFLLTALVVRGPASHGEKSLISVDHVAIKEDVRGFCSVRRILF